MLTSRDIINKIQQYLTGEITSVQLVDWAEVMESDEELEYEKGYEKNIATALFWLSTPEINYEITPEFLRELVIKLERKAVL